MKDEDGKDVDSRVDVSELIVTLVYNDDDGITTGLEIELVAALDDPGSSVEVTIMVVVTVESLSELAAEEDFKDDDEEKEMELVETLDDSKSWVEVTVRVVVIVESLSELEANDEFNDDQEEITDEEVVGSKLEMEENDVGANDVEFQ